MAEINLQPKRPGAWVWIVGLIACGLLVWAIVGPWRDAVPDRNAVTAPAVPVYDTAATSGAGAAPPPAVSSFLTFAEGPVGTAGGPAHDYSADGIRRLGDALDAVMKQQRVDDASMRDQLSALQEKAERIQKDPQSGAHAAMVREGFTSAAGLMSSLQRGRGGASAEELRSQIEHVQSAAEAIDPTRPLLDQTPAVDAFFDRAAAALRTMVAA